MASPSDNAAQQQPSIHKLDTNANPVGVPTAKSSSHLKRGRGCFEGETVLELWLANGY